MQALPDCASSVWGGANAIRGVLPQTQVSARASVHGHSLHWLSANAPAHASLHQTIALHMVLLGAGLACRP